LNASGKVGIGTTEPSYTLDISGSNTAFRVQDNNGAGAELIFGAWGDTLWKYNSYNLAQINWENAPGDAFIKLFRDGGTESVKISADGTTYLNGGVVGIGTITPGATLDVNGTLRITGNAFFDANVTIGNASADTVTVNANSWTFANDTNFVLSGGINGLSFDTDTLSIDASNNRVGIGTTSPDSLLTVYSDGSKTGSLFHIATSSTDALYVNASGYIGLGTDSPSVSLYINTTDAVRLPVGTDAQRPSGTVGMIRFNTTASRFEGYNGTGWTGLGGVIDLDQDTYIIPESTPGADEDVLFFYAAGTERMRLTAAGNIGIGTTSPDTLLHLGDNVITHSLASDSLMVSGGLEVDGTAYFDGATTISGLTTLANASTTQLTVSDYLWIGDDNTDNLDIRAGIWNLASTATTTVAMTNGINFDSNTFVIDPNSNRVGIGTTGPGVRLDVLGDHVSGVGMARFKGTGTAGYLALDTTTAGESGFLLSSAGTLIGQFGAIDSGDRVFIKNRIYGTDEIVSITSTGNVGIGTTGPSARLAIKGGGADILNLFDSAGAEKVTVLNNGNVGIGTAEPIRKLHIYKSSGDVGAKIESGDNYVSLLLSGGQIGDVTWGLMSGYPNAGDFTIRQAGVANYVTVKKTTGNVGIGTTSPDSLLTVYSDGSKTGPLFHIATSSTDALYVDANGNVGIGTDSPTYALHILNDDSSVLKVESSGSNNANILIGAGNGGNAASVHFYSGGYQRAIVTGGRDGDSGQPGYLLFKTRPSSGEMIERIKIDSTGNVGIATTSPDSLLTVYSDGSKTGPLFHVATSSTDALYVDANGNVGIGTGAPESQLHVQGNLRIQNTNPIFRFVDVTTLRGRFAVDSGGFYIDTPAGQSVRFRSGAAYTDRMIIEGGGNVGIGTTSPNTLLHIGDNVVSNSLGSESLMVSGDLEVDGTAYFDGATTISGLTTLANASTTQLTVSD